MVSWVCAGLDRNGLRPMRYVVTGDGLMIAGSEAGMVPVDEKTQMVEKGALGPGQMIAVDMASGQLFHDTEIKDKLARRPALWRMGRTRSPIWTRTLASVIRERRIALPGASLRRRQIAAGYTIEELEQILAPMA